MPLTDTPKNHVEEGQNVNDHPTTLSELEDYYKERERQLMEKLRKQEAALASADEKLRQLVENQKTQLDERNEQSAAREQALKKELYRDSLTGAYNRRYYEDIASRIVGPAGLIVTLCKNGGMSGVLTTTLFWLIIILVYYFIATFISIDAIIGKIYPVFGICLIIMAVGVIFGIFTNPAYTIPEIWANFSNMHPSNTPIWSFMFITVACGAISGFHSTQSPLMARCMKSEKQGHFVFYGAMVSEGIIALIWAAAGCALYTITDGKMVGLAEALAAGQSAAIYDVCLKTMGNVGVALAMIGVVICPITSGDTAFRSARLTLADWLKIDQDSYANRLKLCIPVLGVGAFLGIGNALGFINYTVIWRYFSWTNQTLAMIVLWAASMYLFKEKKNFWITAVPATFMSAVSCTYFVLAPECLGKMINTYADGKLVAYNTAVAYPIGIVFAIAMLALFLHATKKSSTSKA